MTSIASRVEAKGAPCVADQIREDVRKLEEMDKHSYHEWDGLYLLIGKDGKRFALQWRFEHAAAMATALGAKAANGRGALPVGMAVIFLLYVLALLDGQQLVDIDRDSSIARLVRGTLAREGGVEAQRRRREDGLPSFMPRGWEIEDGIPWHKVNGVWVASTADECWQASRAQGERLKGR